MFTRFLMVSALATAALVPALAQQPAFEKWLNEDVAWIISDQERAAFEMLQTDDERQAFIDLFWLRRDPTPNTEVNEFREEHYRRLQWANDRLGGWNSDRGLVYIRYGAPDEKEEHPADVTSNRYELWRYRLLEGIGKDIVLQFVSASSNPYDTREFFLAWSASNSGMVTIPGTKAATFRPTIRYVEER